MSIIRINKKENPFVQIDKGVFMDNRISWKAKGIMGYLLSRPNDWKTYVIELQKHASDGRDSTTNGLNELMEYGYVVRREVREKGQFKGYDYDVFEEPLINTENGLTENGLSVNGKTEIGKPVTTNKDLTNKDLTNKDLTNNNYVEQQELSTNNPIKELIEHLNKETGKNFNYKSKGNTNVITPRLNEGYTVEQCKKMISYHVKEWTGTKFESYLRPATLFKIEKFDDRIIASENYMCNYRMVDKEVNKDFNMEDWLLNN